jgi:hypothetical protein
MTKFIMKLLLHRIHCRIDYGDVRRTFTWESRDGYWVRTNGSLALVSSPLCSKLGIITT